MLTRIIDNKTKVNYGDNLINLNKLFDQSDLRCGNVDIAHKMNTYGHVIELKRTKVGNFSSKTSILLDDLLKIRQSEHEFNFIHSSVSMLDDILAYEVVEKEDLKNLSLGKSIIINLNNLIKPLLNSVDKKLVFLSFKGNIISYGKLNNDLFIPKKILL